MSSSNVSMLRQLADIISGAIDNIDTNCNEMNVGYPDLDDPFNPVAPSEAASMAPENLHAAALVVAACAQLIATVNVPGFTLYNTIGGFHVSSAMRAAVESNVVEILRGHPQGLHAKDIAKQNGMGPDRVSRVLRLLATHHIFVETSPGVFKNNRLSSMMDTLKSVTEIQSNPEKKHVGTPGLSALIEHSGDEVMKGSAYMTEVLLHPTLGRSEAPEDCSISFALKTNKSAFVWFEDPGNEARHKRFNAAMEGTARVDPPDAILQGFNWGSLPPKSVVVDVGGGLGHITAKLFIKYPNLHYVIQDRPRVIVQAKEYWKENYPSAVQNSVVEFQDYDFFTEQTVGNASVYLLRWIIHDHGKTNALRILRNLRSAAAKETKLIIVDQIVPYACFVDDNHAIGGNIRGAQVPVPPKPLLANLGKANAIVYSTDLQMLVGVNGEERTLGTFVELTGDAGWRIVEVFAIPGSVHKQIVAVPA